MFARIITITLLVVDIFVSCGTVPSNEIAGLEYLYNSTNGTNWSWKSDKGHWNFTTDANPCKDQWEGINCTADCLIHPICNIISIDLRRYKLIGTIPPQISLLSSLEKFSVPNNALNKMLLSDLIDISW